MSGHEHERLSAYLDDALAPAERAQVAEHLASCGECAARMAELAAVDEAVACLRPEAPQGYFEALPGRVRARLEPRTRVPRLPVWAWAAAAAALLLVVTPLTLLRRPVARVSVPAQAVPAAAPPPLAKARTTAGAPAAEESRAELKAEPQAQRPVAVLASPQPSRREPAFASAPTEADVRLTQERPAPLAAPPPAAAARQENAVALADAPANEAVASDTRGPARVSGERERAEASGIAARAATDETTSARGRVAAPAAGALAAPKLARVEAEWRRLEAARPHTPAQWRQLREEWRGFVARDPGGPQADEARVRMIEAGREAWRSGNEPADAALFRRDAADYLERDDAAHKGRVESLLRR